METIFAEKAPSSPGGYLGLSTWTGTYAGLGLEEGVSMVPGSKSFKVEHLLKSET